MSFGYSAEQHNIGTAIRQAMFERDASILLFAAATNSGANDREMYPARDDSVISIRGTNTKGDFEDFNPPPSSNDKLVFGTLGVDVPSSWLSDYDGQMHLSGTSIATAVAAGIAGILMGYVSGKSNEHLFREVNE